METELVRKWLLLNRHKNCNKKSLSICWGFFVFGGQWGIRTPDPLGVNEVLWTNWANCPFQLVCKYINIFILNPNIWKKRLKKNKCGESKWFETLLWQGLRGEKYYFKYVQYFIKNQSISLSLRKEKNNVPKNNEICLNFCIP